MIVGQPDYQAEVVDGDWKNNLQVHWRQHQTKMQSHVVELLESKETTQLQMIIADTNIRYAELEDKTNNFQWRLKIADLLGHLIEGN